LPSCSMELPQSMLHESPATATRAGSLLTGVTGKAWLLLTHQCYAGECGVAAFLLQRRKGDLIQQACCASYARHQHETRCNTLSYADGEHLASHSGVSADRSQLASGTLSLRPTTGYTCLELNDEWKASEVHIRSTHPAGHAAGGSSY
jgi:hypothetical protein